MRAPAGHDGAADDAADDDDYDDGWGGWLPDPWTRTRAHTKKTQTLYRKRGVAQWSLVIAHWSSVVAHWS